jgi:hypothetical protein
VASHVPNAFGLYDTTGNVAEWTGVSGANFYYALSYRYLGPEILQDRKIPPEPSQPVIVRGGSFDSVSKDLQLHVAQEVPAERKASTIGFRCVLNGTDLEKVAVSYRINPFYEQYGKTRGPYDLDRGGPYFDALYRAWFDNVYLRYIGVEHWRKRERTK